jgi:hypothetical protein
MQFSQGNAMTALAEQVTQTRLVRESVVKPAAVIAMPTVARAAPAAASTDSISMDVSNKQPVVPPVKPIIARGASRAESTDAEDVSMDFSQDESGEIHEPGRPLEMVRDRGNQSNPTISGKATQITKLSKSE